METKRISFSPILIPTLIVILLPYLCQSLCDSGICQCSNSVCQTCLSPYFIHNTQFQNNQCVVCQANCQKCISTNNKLNCLTCVSGYHLNTNSNNCQECNIQFCRTCPSKQQCQKCINGYTLALSDTSTKLQCVPCAVQNSQTCDSQNSVSTCKSGYWKNGDSCSPCRQFCSHCTSSTNCLQCLEGFRPVVSAGTYCTPCTTGCKQCSSSGCTSCKNNYRLASGSCFSILTQCNLIGNCDVCSYSAGIVACSLCKYPYYLYQNKCVQGSSLLCSNGASGPHTHDCLNKCPDNSYQLAIIEGTRLLCKPLLWLQNTDIIQYFYSANQMTIQSSYSPFISAETFVSLQLSNCSSSSPYIISYFYSPMTPALTSTLRSTLIIRKNLPPYYKISLKIQAIPLYKSISGNLQISLFVLMSDNATNQYTQQVSSVLLSDNSKCNSFYLNLQSKIVKDQQLTISFIAQIKQQTNINNQFIDLDFVHGLIGYKQILMQVYRCSSQCRICSNSKYCLQCYGQLFLYQNQCVSQCYGFFQFYAPDGNPLTYTHKSCLQQCPSGFFSQLSPYKQSVYICSKCQSPCKTCKSSTQCLSCQQPYLYYDLNFQCLAECPLTHYNSTTTSICTPCNSPCKTCLSQIQCLSCSIGYYIPNQNKCLPQCPTGSFKNLTTKTCQNCSSKCSQCTISENICKKCVSPYYLLDSSCVNNCPINTHYENTVISNNRKCQTCKLPCYQCISQTSCLTCSIGYLLSHTCHSICPPGYYRNISKNICSSCKIQCLQCSSLNTCLECANGYYLFGSECLSECPQRTYATNGSSICLPCIQPCYDCLNAEHCLSCQIGYLSQIQVGICLMGCENGYYQSSIFNNITNLTDKLCLSCSIQCLTCINSPNQCTACSTSSFNTTKYLFATNCVDQCPKGYYPFLQKCQPCTYPCQSCSNNAQNCLSCLMPYIYSITSNKCVAQCSYDQFKYNRTISIINTEQIVCTKCLYPCKTCKSQILCSSCIQNQSNQTFLHKNQCLQQCPSRTYPDIFTYKCRQCSYPCNQCIDSKTCLSCSSGYLTILNRCEICPPNYYPNQTEKKCYHCGLAIDNCEQCSTYEHCRQCKPQYYLYISQTTGDTTCIGEGQCQSKSQHYVNTQQMTCSRCLSPCIECIAESKCSSCQIGYLFNVVNVNVSNVNNNKCLLECPKGYYQEDITKTCQPCNLEICERCSGGPVSCLSCNTNSSSQFPVFMVNERLCVRQSDCPSQYYIDTSYGYKRCLKCQPPCLRCSGARNCLSCISGILHESQCRTSCPTSYFTYITPTTPPVTTCNKCQFPCLNCRTNNQTCISCQSPYYLQQNSCVQQCSLNYYLEQNTLECKICQYPCLKCISNSYCTQCMADIITNQMLILYYGQCIVWCPDGTYNDENNLQCMQCPQQCQLCYYDNTTLGNNNISQSLIKCQKCSPSYYMNSTSPGQCQQSCQSNQYADSYTRQCYQCQEPCSKCMTGIQCTECIDGYLLYGKECHKGKMCPDGTFKHPTNPECLKQCPSSYYGQPFTKTCTLKQCLYNYLKDPVSKQCVSKCPTNYYLAQNRICHSCTAKQQQQQNYCKNQLLVMQLAAKSIFNVLYLRIIFNQQIQLSVLQQNQIAISYKQIATDIYEKLSSSSRLLVQIQQDQNILNFQFKQFQSTNTLWIKVFPNRSLYQTEIKVSIQSYYVFPNRVLQTNNATTILKSYDQYYSDPNQVTMVNNLQLVAIVFSIVLCLLIFINLITNTGYLTYPLIDYYQLLFILLYINIDYTPTLNHFLYGFRYSHYLFLPQIFVPDNYNSTIVTGMPEKFGILAQDASFLNNTGHDFVIMFACLGVLAVCKIMEGCMKYIGNKIRNNRIRNSALNIKSNSGKSQPQQQSQNQSDKPPSNQSSNSNFHTKKNNNNTPSGIQQQQQSRVVAFLQCIIHRFKYNYFNDFLYLIYFYLVMFALVQTYEIENGISIILALLFIILGIGWVILLAIAGYMLAKKQSLFQTKTVEQKQKNEEQKQQSYQIQHQQPKQHPQTPNKIVPITIIIPKSSYTCFLNQIKPSHSHNRLGINLPLIYYIRKLILAFLFTYCSNYPTFIMGVIITLSIILITVKLVYQPYKNKIILGNYVIMEGLFVSGCILLMISMVVGQEWTYEGSPQAFYKSVKSTKQYLSIITIIIFILLCIYSTITTILMFIITGIASTSTICAQSKCLNFIKKFYNKHNVGSQQQISLYQQEQSQSSEEKKVPITISNDDNNNVQQQQEQSNMRLKITCYDYNNQLQIIKQSHSDQQQQEYSQQLSSDLGIYLTKKNRKYHDDQQQQQQQYQSNSNQGNRPPKLLIKCMKGEQQQQHSQEEYQQQSNSHSIKSMNNGNPSNNIFNHQNKGKDNLLVIEDDDNESNKNNKN